MNPERINDPSGFIEGLGGLHDVRIAHLAFDVEQRDIVLSTPDLNANFRDPGDTEPAARPCRLVLRGVVAFRADLAGLEGVRIGSATIEKHAGFLKLDVNLADGGPPDRIWERCLSVVFDDLLILDPQASAHDSASEFR